MMRLDKYLAERTGMTRSESRKAITKGRVMVAGKICRKADTQMDETAAQIALDLVAADYPRRELFPAGRLDKTSTGFVLLTDDGALAHDILAPAHHVDKQYLVTLDTPLTEEMRRGFAAGVTLADGEHLAPAEAEPAGDNPCTVRVTLHQGVYHQIKRMFGVYDAGVNTLHRLSIGGVALDATLAPGEYRELTEEERKQLQN